MTSFPKADFGPADFSASAGASSPSAASATTGSEPNLVKLFGSLKSDSLKLSSEEDQQQRRQENQLAMVRLGIATSLYFALRVRHSPTAAHGLRVALVCSAWSARLGITGRERDRIEVAALLHDVGKIGIPDRILRKPGKLSVDEQLTMSSYPGLSCEILAGCTDDAELLNIVRHADVWFEGRRLDDTPRGQALPLGSRMLAIAGAYDAMTTDHVYRPARSRELAIRELIAGSGTQFDPELALDYSRMLEEKPEFPQGSVVDCWLQQLQPSTGRGFWSLADRAPTGPPIDRNRSFYNCLTDDLQDGVAFTDLEGTVTYWNVAMERISSIKSGAIIGQSWSDEIIRLRHPDGERDGNDCPVAECLRHGTTRTRTMRIERPGAEPIPVQVRVSPVTGEIPGIQGTVIVIRDLSEQIDLEQQLESLHEQAIRDPLTGIANRAELDRILGDLTSRTVSGSPTFSLVMCDIDQFKRTNDIHGHQAGDEALVQFAHLLSQHAREGDLVARYGGEEFVLVAVDCDNATASRRAESIRQAIERAPLNSLGGESVTASFGVTEFQTGDSAETVFARADRALLCAKDNGRNRVVQLGSGKQLVEENPGAQPRGWLRWFDSGKRRRRNQYNIVTPVPLELAIEKLRGFVADHRAEILSVSERQLSLRISAIGSAGGRRTADKLVALRVQLTLSEIPGGEQALSLDRGARKTKVHVSLQPIRNRNRRGRELKNSVRQVMLSLQSYLMGQIVPVVPEDPAG